MFSRRSNLTRIASALCLVLVTTLAHAQEYVPKDQSIISLKNLEEGPDKNKFLAAYQNRFVNLEYADTSRFGGTADHNKYLWKVEKVDNSKYDAMGFRLRNIKTNRYLAWENDRLGLKVNDGSAPGIETFMHPGGSTVVERNRVVLVTYLIPLSATRNPHRVDHVSSLGENGSLIPNRVGSDDELASLRFEFEEQQPYLAANDWIEEIDEDQLDGVPRDAPNRNYGHAFRLIRGAGAKVWQEYHTYFTPKQYFVFRRTAHDPSPTLMGERRGTWVEESQSDTSVVILYDKTRKYRLKLTANQVFADFSGTAEPDRSSEGRFVPWIKGRFVDSDHVPFHRNQFVWKTTFPGAANNADPNAIKFSRTNGIYNPFDVRWTEGIEGYLGCVDGPRGSLLLNGLHLTGTTRPKESNSRKHYLYYNGPSSGRSSVWIPIKNGVIPDEAVAIGQRPNGAEIYAVRAKYTEYGKNNSTIEHERGGFTWEGTNGFYFFDAKAYKKYPGRRPFRDRELTVNILVYPNLE